MSTAEELAAIRAELAEEQKNGTWRPAPGDPLAECEFVKTGFRSWGLEAPDHSWKVVLSRLDFGDSNPSALMTVYAPNNQNAFGDLDWFAFSQSLGVNGGTNFNQCVARLSETLGGSKIDWARRLTYLIAKSRAANAGANNGTFSTTVRPSVGTPPPFVFFGRIREGRTCSFFGPGSAGKTTIVDGLLVSLCAGIEIIPGWVPTRQRPVLVLDWDEGREEEEVRLRAICNAYDVELDGGYHYKRMARPLHDVADEIGAYVANNRIEVVVVSPVGRAIRNMGDNQTAPIDELYEILRAFGSTNILIDHVTGENQQGGAIREYGSIRKRDNARGSYSVYAQSESMGERSIVISNTKPDALAPKQPPHAIKVEYDPPEGENGTYRSIFFSEDVVIESGVPTASIIGGDSMRIVLRNMLRNTPLTVDDMVDQTGYGSGSIRVILNRYKDWFVRRDDGLWDVLEAEADDDQDEA